MFCPKCGTNNPDDSVFCGGCGYKFTAPVAAAGSAAGVVEVAQPGLNAQAASGKKKTPIIVAAIIIVLIIAIVLFFTMCMGPKTATYRITSSGQSLSLTFTQAGDTLSIEKGPIALKLKKVADMDGGTAYELPMDDLKDLVQMSNGSSSGYYGSYNPVAQLGSFKVLIPSGFTSGNIRGQWRMTATSNGETETVWANVQDNGTITYGSTTTDGFSGGFTETSTNSYGPTVTYTENNGTYTINAGVQSVILEYLK